MARTVNEKLAIEAVRHRLFLARFSTAEANKMIALLKKMDLRVSMQLAEALEESGINQFNFTQTRLRSLKKSIQKLITDTYEQVFGQLAADLEESAQYETTYQAKSLGDVLPVKVAEIFPVQAVTWQQVYAAATSKPFQGRTLKEWATKLPEDLIERVGNAVQQGILSGDSYTDIIKRVRGTKEANYGNGALAAGRNNLATIVKTAVSHVAADARDQTADANEDLIKARKQLSTLDSHTSKICIARDGKLWTFDKKPIGHSIPYGQGAGKLHFCCRSVETWVIKSWEELGIPAKDMPEGQRASMNGVVPANMTYPEWLASQPNDVLVRVVGVARAELIKTGRIQPDAMFTDKGEWLTLDQLKAADLIKA